MIRLNYDNVLTTIDFEKYRSKLEKINEGINQKKGAGNDYLGWADWPLHYDKKEFNLIKETALMIRETFDTLVVTGIGGS
ncbi:MAG: glucose-6-phosphate isomerase, partial [Erysipelotrichaceae bacterium]|nr:glucose-6-phosphate isomerase [Erysipelotrichaceae bacterium]